MTYKILSKIRLSASVVRLEVHAPLVVRHAQPGQFVVVMCDGSSERIPLTIASFDREKCSISLIFQEAGFSTKCLGSKEPGDGLFAILGPLGQPTHIEKFGDCICVGGGVGIAEMLPVAAALKKAENRVTGIVGARTRELLILQKELEEICDELLIATDNGSLGRKGYVTDILIEELRKRTCSYVYAIGPVPMMKRVADITRPLKIKTVVSLNPLMVDATGMCAVCRCRVAGKTVFGCVDGPEFDAHEVDFDELAKRLDFFKDKEEEISRSGLSGT